MKIYIYLISFILMGGSGFAQSIQFFAFPDTEINHLISSETLNHPDEKRNRAMEGQGGMLTDNTKLFEDSVNLVSADTIPWHKIDLSSPLMKKKSRKTFRWWIPATIAGGALGIAGTALIFSSGTTEPPEPNIFARNDMFSVPCKMKTTVSPLLNDIGEGLRIISISGAPAGWVEFTDQSIDILETASQNFTFNYTIADIHGEQSSAIVSITIEYSPIQLQNSTFQAGPGDIITHQIFANAVCSECIVSSASSAPQTNFTWTPSGNFHLEIPAVIQPQTVVFTFVVTDRCGQTGTAQISVSVRPDCTIEPSFIVSNEECDFEDGSIEVTINPINNYRFQWSNGMTTALISGLSKGIYQVTITLISNPACSEVFTVEVSSSSPELSLMNDRYQAVSNVLLTGNVLNNDVGTQLWVTAFDDLDVIEFTIQPDGSFRFLADENALTQYTSVYTVSDICGATSTAIVQFDVAKVPCDFSAAITTNPADCGVANGTASVIVSPVGAPYEIRWPNGTIGPSASGLPAGYYTLMVTNTANNCVLNFNFIIEEKPVPNYIQTIETSAATCIGGAQIDLVLNNPAGGTMQLIVTRENMPFISVSVSSGLIKLGEFANILPGVYQISVSCSGCPPRCAQIVNLTISEVLPLLEINDDVASIPTNTVWSGNVLLNDIGAGMSVVGFTQPSAGNASVNSNGIAVYNPPAGFSGVVTFNYTVRDTCGQEKSAIVTINVIELPCDFTAQFSNTPADCGMMNGSSTVDISPAGSSYIVNWPDGTQGLSNAMLSPGNYTVTISNENAGCTLMFSTSVSELPPLELIQQITTEAATCISGGNATYTILNPLPIDIVVEIYMNNQFLTSASINPFGSFSSEIGPLLPGAYLLQAQLSNSPRRCADSDAFEILIDELPMNIMDDNFTIPFGTAWVGNVLLNDIGTGLQVTGNTTSPSGTIQILPDGNGIFVPNPGFSGLATFQYFARDVCNQEQKANVNITVLPFTGGVNSEGTTFSGVFEFFQQPLTMMNATFFNSVPEGISAPNFITYPGFQNGLGYSMFIKKWLLRTEVSFAESASLNGSGQMIYQNSYQSRIGLGWFHEFNGNKIIAESGLTTTKGKVVFSGAQYAHVSRHTLQALYFKTEFQIKLKSGHCIYWEPLLLYFPSGRQLSGLLSTGIKTVLK